MHTLTVRTRFTFGDRVRFESQLQRCSGIGTVAGIMVSSDGSVDYMIEIARADGYSDFQPGILEGELALLSPAEGM
ncbi:hypothetical protein VT84_10975 [Gemmata sp. SH-PL17]|uniref:hypothetical protein n=1 Tax=Gemmata sp. SH-PL17 TaxID=1630693 RepID=UPI00078CA064|nr:hypothetical protein [Gemmata sp. SH-PL17]AMV24912.1 hypothetical protein VT84_10975 [Gemmata sp. SH-PL17]